VGDVLCRCVTDHSSVSVCWQTLQLRLLSCPQIVSTLDWSSVASVTSLLFSYTIPSRCRVIGTPQTTAPLHARNARHSILSVFIAMLAVTAVADPRGANPAMPPVQSDCLAINFEFDIKPREVRPSITCFCLCSKQDARVTIDSQEN